jgi:hypothetical protein
MWLRTSARVAVLAEGEAVRLSGGGWVVSPGRPSVPLTRACGSAVLSLFARCSTLRVASIRVGGRATVWGSVTFSERPAG